MLLSPVTLPPELWRQILEEATTQPGGLVTSWTQAPYEKLYRGWETIDYNDPEMGTKLAIVRVCREWRDMGAEFLYQWVRLMSVERTRELVELFQTSTSRTCDLETTSGYRKKQPAYGWWVRRIDVAGMMSERDNMDEVFRFLEQCSRMEAMFKVPPFQCVTDECVRDQASFQVERFPHTLRRLVVHVSSKSMSPGVILDPGPVTLSAVTSLTLTVSWHGHQAWPEWHFPALRFLKLHDIREIDVPVLLPFIDIYGPQLIGLMLRTNDEVSSIPLILSRTPNLQSLVMDEVDLCFIDGYSGYCFASISHIGIHTIQRNASEDTYEPEPITDNFSLLFAQRILPGLVSVRLLAVEDPKSLQTGWSELLNICTARGIFLGGKEE